MVARRIYVALLVLLASVAVIGGRHVPGAAAEVPAPVTVLGAIPPTNISQLVLSGPTPMATGPTGSFYLGRANQVLHVAAGGAITVVAGTGEYGFSGDGGPAEAATLEGVRYVTTSRTGDVFVYTGARVRRISGGQITTVAGNGVRAPSGNQGNGGAATSMSLHEVSGLAADGLGNVFFSEFDTNVVRRVGADGIVSVVAGTGTADETCAAVAGPAVTRDLWEAVVGTVDAADNLYLAAQCQEGFDIDHRILTLPAAGTSLELVAGGGVTPAAEGVSATAARVVFPTTMAHNGALHVLDNAGVVLRIDTGGVLRAVAGRSDCVLLNDGVPAADACVFDYALLSTGGLVATDGSAIGVIATTTVDRLTGSGEPSNGASAASSGVTKLRRLAVEPSGRVLYSTATGMRIRTITTDLIGTLSGSPEGAAFEQYSGPGNGVAMPFSAPLHRGPSGAVYTWSNVTVARVSPADGTVTHVAGTGTFTNGPDGGQAAVTEMTPTAVVESASGAVFVAGRTFGLCGEPPFQFVCAHANVRKVATNGVLSTVYTDTQQDNVVISDLAQLSANELLVVPATGFRMLRLNVDTSVTTDIPFEVGDSARVAVDPAGTVFIANDKLFSMRTAAGVVTPITVTGTDADVDIDAAGNVYLLLDDRIVKYPGLAAPQPADGFNALGAPARLLDTRSGQLGVIEQPGGSVGTDVTVALAPNVVRRFVMTGAAGIPSYVAGLAANVTAVAPSAGGFVKVWGCAGTSTPQPTTSSLNYQSGVTTGNSAIVAPHASGGICMVSSQTTNVIFDVSGYFAAGSGLSPLPSPVRLLDSRAGFLGAIEQPGGSEGVDVTAALQPNAVRRFVLTNTSGVPASVDSLALNVTVIGPSGGGFIKVWGCENLQTAAPTTSTVNFRSGITRGNGAIVAPHPSGGVCVVASQTSNVTLDVSGYFAAGSPFGAVASPTRLLDTRSGLLGAIEQQGATPGVDVASPLAPNVVQRFVLTNVAGLPTSVAGLAMNVTAISPTGGGFVKLWGCESTNTPAPSTSTVNYQSGITTGNSALVAPHSSGGVCLVSSQTTHVSLDVSGFFAFLA
jgi:hypothetical protein